MARSFNVTVIQPPDYIHSAALYEAAEYVHDALLRAGHTAQLSHNRLPADQHNVVFGAHLLRAEHLAALPRTTIVFNSEQLGNQEGWYFRSGHYRELLKRFHVWDYSAANLPHIPHAHKALIPFLYTPALLREAGESEAPGLFFYGSPTPRRVAIIQQLQAAGVHVTAVADFYGPARDAAMRKAWAVLNLHNADSVANFEAIRCFHPLINGVPVITEDETDDPSAALYRPYLFSFRSSELVAGILALQQSADFPRLAQEKLAAFRATSAETEFGAALAAYLQRHG